MRKTFYNFNDVAPYYCPRVLEKPKKLSPKKYEILDSAEIGRYLVVKVKYSGIQEYKGIKILVYESLELETLTEQEFIDPNFLESKKFRSPIAMFEPTLGGWHLALKLCNILRAEQIQCSY
jgi:hypothetical protein